MGNKNAVAGWQKPVGGRKNVWGEENKQKNATVSAQ